MTQPRGYVIIFQRQRHWGHYVLYPVSPTSSSTSRRESPWEYVGVVGFKPWEITQVIWFMSVMDQIPANSASTGESRVLALNVSYHLPTYICDVEIPIPVKVKKTMCRCRNIWKSWSWTHSSLKMGGIIRTITFAGILCIILLVRHTRPYLSFK